MRPLGTHEGPYAGVEPAGNGIDIESITVLRFEDGQLAEMWLQPNTLGMIQ